MYYWVTVSLTEKWPLTCQTATVPWTFDCPVFICNKGKCHVPVAVMHLLVRQLTGGHIFQVIMSSAVLWQMFKATYTPWKLSEARCRVVVRRFQTSNPERLSEHSAVARLPHHCWLYCKDCETNRPYSSDMLKMCCAFTSRLLSANTGDPFLTEEGKCDNANSWGRLLTEYLLGILPLWWTGVFGSPLQCGHWPPAGNNTWQTWCMPGKFSWG